MKKRYLVAAAVLFSALLLVAMSLYVLAEVTFPPRRIATITPQSLLMNSQEVDFTTSDGLKLSGYYIPGRGGTILLCHDFGSNVGDLLPLASTLNEAGYAVLMFDFRAHGKSEGRVSTLGAREKLDVSAALRFLNSRQSPGERGLLGISMGGYAGALAAAGADELKALVLVDPYPDLDSYFSERLRILFHVEKGPLASLMRDVFAIYTGTTGKGWSMEESLPSLKHKTILFVSSQSTERSDQFCHRLYDITPEPKELAVIKGFHEALTLGADKKKMETRILRFFREFLPLDAPSTRVIPAKPESQ